MIKLNEIVKECLEQHVGGEKFFDALDEKCRDDFSLLTSMIDLIKNVNYDYIIVSGKFGNAFKDFCINNHQELINKLIVVNGGLRHGIEISDYYNHYNVNDKEVIFLDDSFYLGRTRDSIKNSLEENNASLIHTYVLYDGSKIKDNKVTSFYRYYDNYGA